MDLAETTGMYFVGKDDRSMLELGVRRTVREHFRQLRRPFIKVSAFIYRYTNTQAAFQAEITIPKRKTTEKMVAPFLLYTPMEVNRDFSQPVQVWMNMPTQWRVRFKGPDGYDTYMDYFLRDEDVRRDLGLPGGPVTRKVTARQALDTFVMGPAYKAITI